MDGFLVLDVGKNSRAAFMRIIDTHAHLDQFEDVDRVLRDAVAVGVEAVVTLSVDLASMPRNLTLKKRMAAPVICAGLGLHPGNIVPGAMEPALDFIRAHVAQADVIGEIGLDFSYQSVRNDEGKKQEQRAVFGRQLEIAREFDLPVVIHSRGAWAESLALTLAAGVKAAVFHWYSGPLDVLKNILDAGYLISASPALAYSGQLRDAVRFAPLSQTLIETDSPVFYRDAQSGGGFKAEPRDVLRTLAAFVMLKNIDQERALEELNANARRFFRITIPSSLPNQE